MSIARASPSASLPVGHQAQQRQAVTHGHGGRRSGTPSVGALRCKAHPRAKRRASPGTPLLRVFASKPKWPGVRRAACGAARPKRGETSSRSALRRPARLAKAALRRPPRRTPGRPRMRAGRCPRGKIGTTDLTNPYSCDKWFVFEWERCVGIARLSLARRAGPTGRRGHPVDPVYPCCMILLGLSAWPGMPDGQGEVGAVALTIVNARRARLSGGAPWLWPFLPSGQRARRRFPVFLRPPWPLRLRESLRPARRFSRHVSVHRTRPTRA